MKRMFIFFVMSLLSLGACAQTEFWSVYVEDDFSSIFPFYSTVRGTEMESFSASSGTCATGETIQECLQYHAAALSSVASSISSINTALAGKEPAISSGTSGTFYAWDKTWRVPAYPVTSVAGQTGTVTLATVATSGAYTDITGRPTLATVATSGAYADLSGKPTIPAAQVNSDWSASSGLAQILNKPSLAAVATSGSYNDLSNRPTIPSAQVQSDWTQSNSGSIDFIKNKPASRSQSSASRSLNSCFQVSSSRDSIVNYSVDIAATISLTSGQTGTVYLEIYSDSGCSTGTQELTRFVNGNTGTLTVGLNLTQNATGTLTGYVPAGSYVKLRTANTSGTPTFNYRSGQEVLL